MSTIRKSWKTVEYSRNQIIKSGKIIKNSFSTPEEIENSIRVIDNWRAAHAYPLHVIYMHLRNMANNNKNIIVAERLKRLDSIINKLKREDSLNLWTMQDLGGCRFIVPTIDEVYHFSDKYNKSRKRHIFYKKNDYIENPKATGYRSLHMVYEYHSDKIDTYNRNMLIEIQYRTRLQHLWATAVETAGLFKQQAIKSGQGDDSVRRFFVLISSLFALYENRPIIPETSSNKNILIHEIKEIDSKYRYLAMLGGIRVAASSHYVKKFKKQGYYILVLHYKQGMLEIHHFTPNQITHANQIYSDLESNRKESNIDAVLVRVSSFQTLKSAYPNYFTDIGDFLKIVRDCLK